MSYPVHQEKEETNVRIRRLSTPQVLISLSAMSLALAVGLVVFLVMRAYQTRQPIWVEQAAYGQWPMVRFQSLIEEQGTLGAIKESLITEDILLNRHLLELWILGILAPQALGWFHAPLLVVIPMFAVFLGLLGWTVYKRSENLFYAIASMMLFCALPQLTDHRWGMGSGFADWQSMFLLSSSALSLINALMDAESASGWVRASAVFLALAVLARITVAFYAFIVCGPILFLYLVTLYKRTRSLNQVTISLLSVLLITGPLVVVMIVKLPDLIRYYGTSNAWNLNHSLQESVSNIFLLLLVPFIGKGVIFVSFISLLITILKTVFPQNKMSWSSSLSAMGRRLGESEIAILWWCIGFLGFLLIKGYTSDVPKEVMYAIAPFLLICLSPVINRNSPYPRFANSIAFAIILFSVVNFIWAANQNLQVAKTADAGQKLMRRIQLNMAEILSKIPEKVSWQSYTGIDWGIPVSLLTEYHNGRFQESRGWYFYNRKEYWDTWYPGLTLEQLQEKLYWQTSDCVDVVVILGEPDQKPPGMEEYSYSIAAYISRQVQSNTYWTYVDELNGWPDGTRYRVYRNTRARYSSSCLK